MTNRQSLLDDDMTPTREQSNVFDDEFEVEDFDVVTDGFRPGQSHDREGGRQSHEHDETVRTVSAQYATGAVVSAGPSRNSTRKSRGRENPFSSPEDGDEHPLRRTASGNFVPDIAQRSVSSASSTQYAGSNTPRFGTDGPSHPYGMYPQGTVARTLSMATTSTAQPTRQSSSRYAAGPQHPYSLYPQGVSDDFTDDDTSTAQNPVPVGFLGTQQFRRQRGPDGEEQDILGDYGHIEQLPPYTRYPEDGPEKAPLLDVPAPPTALHSRAPVLGSDPGMSLMHTQILPPQQQQPQSMTDESDLQRQNSRLSRLSQMPDPPDDEDTTAETSLLSKKSWSEKSWSERRKTRFCGIPFWVVIAFVMIVVFAGGILGGALGGFAAGQKSGSKQALQKAASSTLYDASLITTSTAAPPATGTYPLSLGLPQETAQACLTQAGDRAAWSCDLVGSDQVWISVEAAPDGNNTGAYLFTKAGSDPSVQLSYGAQVSNMFTPFSPLLYVHDRDDLAEGPAFYFQQEYNKLVVVAAEAIDVPNRRLKRNAYGKWPDWLVQKQYATPGDKPWFCYWNNTMLEGFIYMNQPAVINPTLSFSSSTPGSTSSSKSSTITPGPTSPSTGPLQSHTAPWTITGVDPSATVTTTISMATTSCTYTGVASEFPGWMADNYPDYEHYVDGPLSPPRQKRGDDDSGTDHDNGSSDEDEPFEYLVKVEERRLGRSPAPMCVQYQVLDDYTWNVVTDQNGAQITITLSEADPPLPQRRTMGRLKRGVVTGCHCQWMSGD